MFFTMKMMSESAKLVDGHYSLCLALKKKAIQMPNNHVMAEQGALNLKRRVTHRMRPFPPSKKVKKNMFI